MKCVILVILSFCAFTQSVTGQDVNQNSSIRAFVKKVTQSILSYLDPAVVPLFGPVQIDSFVVPIAITLHNFKMDGLSQTNVEFASFDPSHAVLTAGLRIPWLFFTGEYECKASIFLLSQTATASYMIKLEDVQVQVGVQISSYPNGRIKLEDMYLMAVIGRTQVLLKDQGGSSMLNSMIDRFVQKAASENLKSQLKETIGIITQVVAPVVGDILSQYDYNKLIPPQFI